MCYFNFINFDGELLRSFPDLFCVYRFTSTVVNVSGCWKILLYISFPVLHTDLLVIECVNVSGCRKKYFLHSMKVHSLSCIQSCQYRCEYVWVQKDTFIHSILCPLYRIVSTGVNVFGCRKMHLYPSFPVLCT